MFTICRLAPNILLVIAIKLEKEKNFRIAAILLLHFLLYIRCII